MEQDNFLDEAKKIIVENNKVSQSMLQRKLYIGYVRACNIIEQLEAKNFITKQEDGSYKINNI